MNHTKENMIDFLHQSYENAGVWPKKDEDIARHMKIISRMWKIPGEWKMTLENGRWCLRIIQSKRSNDNLHNEKLP